MQEKGIGTRVNFKNAQDLYKKAVEMGEPNAQLKLAMQMFLSTDSNEQDVSISKA
jgi:TPR repeat protein